MGQRTEPIDDIKKVPTTSVQCRDDAWAPMAQVVLVYFADRIVALSKDLEALRAQLKQRTAGAG
jgi:hypothetical protein